jgi:exonuclease VII small subunit
MSDDTTHSAAGAGATAAPPAVATTQPPQPVELTFEQGYDRLQEIARRLGDQQVSVSEMCELFAEGRGLELALTEFLDHERARVEAIERGEDVRAFRISRAGAGQPDAISAAGQPDATSAAGQPDATSAAGQPDATSAAGRPDASPGPRSVRAHDELPF